MEKPQKSQKPQKPQKPGWKTKKHSPPIRNASINLKDWNMKNPSNYQTVLHYIKLYIYIYMQSTQWYSSKCTARHLTKCSGDARRQKVFSKTTGAVASALLSTLPMRKWGHWAVSVIRVLMMATENKTIALYSTQSSTAEIYLNRSPKRNL